MIVDTVTIFLLMLMFVALGFVLNFASRFCFEPAVQWAMGVVIEFVDKRNLVKEQEEDD